MGWGQVDGCRPTHQHVLVSNARALVDAAEVGALGACSDAEGTGRAEDRTVGDWTPPTSTLRPTHQPGIAPPATCMRPAQLHRPVDNPPAGPPARPPLPPLARLGKSRGGAPSRAATGRCPASAAAGTLPPTLHSGGEVKTAGQMPVGVRTWAAACTWPATTQQPGAQGSVFAAS